MVQSSVQLAAFVPVVAALLYKLYLRHQEEQTIKKTKPKITRICIYPIKSCRGINLTTGRITATGFQYDRNWMIIDAKTNRFITQRQNSKLASVVSSFTDEHLVVRAPGMEPLKLPLHINKQANRSVQIWTDDVMAIDEGPVAAQWISKFLGKEACIVRMDPKVKRTADASFWKEEMKGSHIVSFSDGFPFLLFSQESVDFINKQLEETSVSYRRFRPNIVVENVKEAFDEDTWHTFQIRDITFHAIKPCPRCKVTTIDQDTGEVLGDEPLATLKQIRQVGDSAYFGQNVVHESEGYICVGDTVDILETQASLSIKTERA